jgi:thiol-disulfide isomerase/thioredoxin
MSVLIACAALVVALLAFVVALGAANRLRDAMENGGIAAAGHRAPLPPVLTEIEDFVTPRLDGTAFTKADLAGDNRLVGFFATGCPSCKDQLPAFLAAAGRQRGAATPVAVLSGSEGDTRELAQIFPKDVTVVTESDLAFSRSAKVDGYPTFIVVTDGKVTGSATRVDRLPAGV